MLRRKSYFGLSFGVIALGVSLVAGGCDAILGIHDVEPDPTGGGGTGGTTTGGGGTGGTTTGGGGTGGSTAGDFAFAATSPDADLPISGQAFLGVQIQPENGFSGDVTIGIKLAPADVTFEGVTLPAGTLTGAVKLGAKASATLGQQLSITLVATSGAISHETTVQGTVTGTPGTLVDSFGSAGITSWTLAMDGGNVFDLREVAQGKLLTTGDNIPALSSFLKGSRVLVGGAMDTTFGPNMDGLVTAQFCGCSKPSEGRSAMRLLNGNIVMVGTGNKGSGFTDDIALLRLKDDGNVDNVAGDGGKALVDLGGIEAARAAELTSDEHIVVTGIKDTSGFVARIDTFGNLDSAFGPNGSGFTTFTGVGTALAIDAQQRVVVAGAAPLGGDAALAVVRYSVGGTLDASFPPYTYGGSGIQGAIGVAHQSDGKIIVVGLTEETGTPSVIVLRLLDDGALDTTFGTNGKTILEPAGGGVPVDMAVMTDDRIVIGGNASGTPFLMRVLASGAPDPTFGTGGVKTIFLGNQAAIQAITMTSARRIAVAGYRESQPTKGFVAKVWN